MDTPCEICGRSATHADNAVPDPNVVGLNASECGYRRQYLCLPHAIERRKQNTARVECMHVALTLDGYCLTCGELCPTSF